MSERRGRAAYLIRIRDPKLRARCIAARQEERDG
jgi:hypothetical protein